MTENLDRLKRALADRYTVEQQLGAGGMATVHLAYDIRHDRKVAIKVLRPELAAVIGAERFLNEIKVTANLQNPHILQLFDSGEADCFLYYVMAYVGGESLREKLEREKQLPIEESIAITKEVAAALDYAHRQGVIHRDIKPENILLHDGHALVADFGIALAVDAAGGTRLTETGLSLGTPQYMSPEQATSDRELDARSDVYSLGATVYEMLVGEPPFAGSTAQAIVAKVLVEPPPLATTSRDTVPQHVSVAIQQALAKLPADRFGGVREFIAALENPELAAPPASLHRQPMRRATTRWMWPAIVLGLAGLAAWGWLRPEAPSRVMRFNVTLPSPGPVIIGRSAALSPDGSRIVHVVNEPGGRNLYLRATSELVSTPLSGSRGGSLSPFFSPDGRDVAFGTFDNTIVKVAAAGGPPVVVTDSVALSGADWGPDDRIYFTHTATGGLARVPASGGAVEQLAGPDTVRGETEYRWPAVLPNGRGALVTIWHTAEDEAEVGVVDFDDRAVHVLTPGTYPRYATSGHLIYCRLDGTLMAAPFDADRLELAGAPTPLSERVLVKSDGSAELAISDDGTLLYQQGVVPTSTLVRVWRDGSEEPLDVPPRSYNGPRLAPDGQRFAVIVTRGSVPFRGDLWTYDLRNGTLSRVTFDGQSAYPAWLPNGRILFSSDRGGERDLYSVVPDASGAVEVMFERRRNQWEGLLSADGDWLVYRETGGSTGRDIRYRSLAPPERDSAFLTTPFEERSLALSPDGRWLAYVSDESGRDEVYVRPFPTDGGRLQITTDGGSGPVWARSGEEVFYLSRGSLVTARVAVSGRGLLVESRHELFDVTEYVVQTPHHSPFDVFPGDQSFLFVKLESVEEQAAVVVVNFFEELKAQVESGGQ